MSIEYFKHFKTTPKGKLPDEQGEILSQLYLKTKWFKTVFLPSIPLRRVLMCIPL